MKHSTHHPMTEQAATPGALQHRTSRGDCRHTAALLLILVAAALALAGCSAKSSHKYGYGTEPDADYIPADSYSTAQTQTGATGTNAPLTVVVTNFPCYDFARAVLGDTLAASGNSDGIQAELKLLIKPGAEVHSFDPSPADIIAVQNADVFIYIGGESDEWVETMLTANPPKATQIQLRLIDYVEIMLDDGGDADEHIWTDPENAAFLVQMTGDALINAAARKAAPYGDEYAVAATELFQHNSDAYQAEIKAVAAEIRSVVNAAAKKKIIVGDRNPLAYFEHYYGLEYDAAFDGCSTAVEASTQTMARLITSIRNDRLPAVFYIELSTHKIADMIGESAGVPSLMLYSIQNVPLKEFQDGETWVTLMKKNAETLKKGLR